MRGFNQNIRNGNSFAVINTELRWPIFKYFIRRPIKSSFISNFQIVGFGDLGTAWNGLDPFSSENSINRKIIQDGPLTIVLYDSSYPIVGGYGFGLRSRILGYFVRTDWAWGVVDGKVQKPIFYLSLCLDI
jgi:outer membrane protein assembly factor BamA